MSEVMRIENRPKLIAGKLVDRWFAVGYDDNEFWQKKEYAIEYFAERGIEAV